MDPPAPPKFKRRRKRDRFGRLVPESPPPPPNPPDVAQPSQPMTYLDKRVLKITGGTAEGYLAFQRKIEQDSAIIIRPGPVVQPATNSANDPHKQDSRRREHIEYFNSLDESDILEYAKRFDIPLKRVEPCAPRMLQLIQLIAQEVS
ncbi:hypothetical protein RhiJN_16622 [Ceratobasidium sp. AG-Ba]|nr:hypothetical protein RhiJN_16622 [Ceratobasidium sp. AG-Ba]